MRAVQLIVIFFILLPLALAPACDDDDYDQYCYSTGGCCSSSICPRIETDSLPVGNVGVLYDFTFETNGEGNHWTNEKQLPADLKLDDDKGRIYGFPVIAGTYSIRVCYKYTQPDQYGNRLLAKDCREFTLIINSTP